VLRRVGKCVLIGFEKHHTFSDQEGQELTWSVLEKNNTIKSSLEGKYQIVALFLSVSAAESMQRSLSNILIPF